MPSYEVVPRVVTPLSEAAARDLLVSTLASRLGRQPTQEMVGLLLALMWVESGRGNFNNWNMGNITASTSYPGKIWRPTWYDENEIAQVADPQKRANLDRLHSAMVAGKAPSAFRAYDSAEFGMADFVQVLFARFPEVVTASETGNAQKFVAALSVKYSPDYNASHIPTFSSLQKGFGERQLLAALPKGAAGEEPSQPLPSSPGLSLSVLEKLRVLEADIPTLRVGSTTFYVVLWRHCLNTLLGTSLTLSTRFDSKVNASTLAFQREFGLKEDGIVGPKTWAKMLESDSAFLM